MNVSIKTLEFPLCIKNKILRIKDITKLNIEYISGKNIIFKNTNLGLFEPHKVIINNNYNGIVIFCYNEDTTFYKNDLSTITMNELTDIINVLLEKIKKILKFIFPLIYKGLTTILRYNFQKRAVACPKKMWYYGNIRQL